VILDVSHRTDYRYTVPVDVSHHFVHLTPRAAPRQRCLRTVMAIDPTPAVSRSGIDYFGNPTSFLTIQEHHQELSIRVRSTVVVEAPPALDPAATAPWETVARMMREPTADRLAIAQFAYDSPFTLSSEPVVEYARGSFPAGLPVLNGALDLNRRIHAEFAYDGTATTVSTPVDEAFRLRRGVCQDFAHVMLAALRGLGLPARYVSGYLLTHPPEGQGKLVGADASHAWISLWTPEYGWVDLDPTNDLIPAEEHVILAWGRDYGDVSPVNGVMYGGGRHAVEVAVDVTPVEVPQDETGF
jgi:transglutaminase-like putative cysteine protease